jgi:hypothetical protein
MTLVNLSQALLQGVINNKSEKKISHYTGQPRINPLITGEQSSRSSNL